MNDELVCVTHSAVRSLFSRTARFKFILNDIETHAVMCTFPVDHG